MTANVNRKIIILLTVAVSKPYHLMVALSIVVLSRWLLTKKKRTY